MPNQISDMDLLCAVRDLGIPERAYDEPGTDRVRAALDREANRWPRRGRRRGAGRWIGRSSRPIVLAPAGVLLGVAVAAAATGIATGVINPFQVAHKNAGDAPTLLFETNPYALDTPTPSFPGFHRKTETVIPSSVRQIETFTIPKVGTVQYWVADTEQHGICGAVRLPDGRWAGLQHGGQQGGSPPGCRPTRAQDGGLVIDGFDDELSDVTDSTGKSWIIDYGRITAPGDATRVRDTFSGTSAPVVDGYYALALRPVGNDYGDDIHLEAFNASGAMIASEGHPLPGSTTHAVRNDGCLVKLRWVRERIPGTHQYGRIGLCAKPPKRSAVVILRHHTKVGTVH